MVINKRADDLEREESTQVQKELEENVSLTEKEKCELDLRKTRKVKLGQLTRQRNIIYELMKDDANANKVKENVVKYKNVLGDFEIIHREYQLLLNEKERKGDQDSWYEPKRDNIETLLNETDQWLSAHNYIGADDCEDQDDYIRPSDSVSVAISINMDNTGSKVSITSSAVGLAEANRAALEVSRGA